MAVLGSWQKFSIVAALALFLTIPSLAGAIALSDPALLTTPITQGPLTFNFTNIESAGGLDLDLIDISFVGSGLIFGFDISAASGNGGGMHTVNGVTADVKLEFTISSTIPIILVSNNLAGFAISLPPLVPLSSVSVSELIAEDGAINVGVTYTNFGSQTYNDHAVGNLTNLTITKNLVIAADSGLSGFAEITLLEQRYSVVPEPGTANLLLLGLVGLAARSRRS